VLLLLEVLRMVGHLPSQLVHSSADANPDLLYPLRKDRRCPLPHCLLLLLLVVVVVARVGVVLAV
jgi:hypothetical protein